MTTLGHSIGEICVVIEGIHMGYICKIVSSVNKHNVMFVDRGETGEIMGQEVEFIQPLVPPMNGLPWIYPPEFLKRIAWSKSKDTKNVEMANP